MKLSVCWFASRRDAKVLASSCNARIEGWSVSPVAGGVTGAVYRVLERIVAHSADSVLCVSADLEERMRAAGAGRVGYAPVPAPPLPLFGWQILDGARYDVVRDARRPIF